MPEPRARGRLVYPGSSAAFWTCRLPALPGAHQIDNAGAAHGGLAPSWPWCTGLARSGDAKTPTWPARMQRLRQRSAAATAAPGVELWLDGGHNAACRSRRWPETIWPACRKRPTHLICGMLNTKDVSGYLDPAGPACCKASPPCRSRARPPPFPPKTTAAAAQRKGGYTRHRHRRKRRIRGPGTTIAAERLREARVLICGSLYLAGADLARATPDPRRHEFSQKIRPLKPDQAAIRPVRITLC